MDEIKGACGLIVDGQKSFTVNSDNEDKTNILQVKVVSTSRKACDLVLAGESLANVKATIEIEGKGCLITCPESDTEACQLWYGPVVRPDGGPAGRRLLEMSNTAKAGAVIDAAKIAYDSYQKCKNTDAASCAQATAETIGCAAASGFVPLLGGLYCQAFIDYAKGGPFPALDLALVAAQNNIDAVIQIAADGYNAIVQKTPEVEWVASMAAESIPQNIENCFPSDALVQTPDNGAKRMDQLRIGDKVLAVGADALTVSLEGHPDKLDDSEELLGSYAIVELQRTGRVALPKLDRASRLRAATPNQKGKVG